MASRRVRRPQDRDLDARKLLLEVERFRLTNGHGISFDELNDRLRYGSKDKVKRDVEWCREKGWLTSVQRTARSIRITQAGRDAVSEAFPGSLPQAAPTPRPHVAPHPIKVDLIPVMPATVAAGPPIESFDSLERYDADESIVVASGELRAPERCFAVRVRGNSMQDAHILDGDLVVLEQTETARPGQIVAVQLPDEGVTLKRYLPEPALGQIRFKAENPDVADIIVPTRDAEAGESLMPHIVGIYRMLRREATRA